mmetsp:Transcript_31079/g.23112  ORF Transcript_31079/g.23112 Transcript_31079/m.23112 type:complete len:136 (+) Transcript_31079:207-614(+)|eukprot:CAMPEP_0202962844 /NCGR_PEP_ID=MMETSP1396-20130829/6890_1 /ASSEMBLY_ACC=CAM_ASM_000872 /TAXON_ID= /ORGANISM="Pseudokeronopsis sp., Strain Brazil" /LENGTH=135 /DNA_ID=CAMNT_0049683651 /DNA_START=207 /DNA_END=614 /DNA_ORIENTATION=-
MRKGQFVESALYHKGTHNPFASNAFKKENDEFLKQIYKKVLVILALMYASAFAVIYMDQRPSFELPALHVRPLGNFSQAKEELHDAFAFVDWNQLRKEKEVVMQDTKLHSIRTYIDKLQDGEIVFKEEVKEQPVI